MDDNSNNKSDEVSQTSGSVPLIEIGWIVAGRLDEIDRQAIETAREETLNYLHEKLPLFLWRMPLLRRKELVASARVAPVDLLDAGVVERNAGHWDFTVVITNADLISHYKRTRLRSFPDQWKAPSSPLVESTRLQRSPILMTAPAANYSRNGS